MSSQLTVRPSQALVAADDLAARLERHARQAEGAVAAETARALASDSRIFTAWCAEAGQIALPAAPETVADFVDAMAEGRRPATVRRYVSSIASLHRAASVPDPTKTEVVRLSLKRMARRLGTRQKQAAPIGELEVERMLATAGAAVADLRNIALVLVMRDLLARRGEAIALSLADLTFAEDGSATALIIRSKTDQTGDGEVRWLAPRTTAALRRWLEAARISEGEVFRAVNKAGRIGAPLTSGDVSRILKRMAGRAGIDPARISGHSCRVGMAQDLVAFGAEVSAVMQAGRWKSPTMPARYAERLLAGRGAVAQYHERRGGRG